MARAQRMLYFSGTGTRPSGWHNLSYNNIQIVPSPYINSRETKHCQSRSFFQATMSKIEFHAMPLSPLSRAVHMILDLIGLDYNYILVDLIGGTTRTPEFLSLNLQHTVSVLVDEDHVVTESRAAITYDETGPTR